MTRVLVVVASAKGSSAQAIYGGTTALYFNNAGKAVNYIAETLKYERARLGKAVEGKMDKDEQERNALFIYQIPLKVKNVRGDLSDGCYECNGSDSEEMECDYECDDDDMKCQNECDDEEYEKEVVPAKRMKGNVKSGMDNAMLSVGVSHSEFTGITNAEIERDPQFPIRCTIQF